MQLWEITMLSPIVSISWILQTMVSSQTLTLWSTIQISSWLKEGVSAGTSCPCLSRGGIAGDKWLRGILKWSSHLCNWFCRLWLMLPFQFFTGQAGAAFPHKQCKIALQGQSIHTVRVFKLKPATFNSLVNCPCSWNSWVPLPVRQKWPVEIFVKGPFLYPAFWWQM